MTIDAIFERYEVPPSIQQHALLKGAFAVALAREWVGPVITWPLVVKALIFSSLGEHGAHIRKKVGLDKYVVTVIVRGNPKFVEGIAQSHDLHQIVYAYASLQNGTQFTGKEKDAWQKIVLHVEQNLLRHVPPPTHLDTHTEEALRSMNILHYKNPSV